MTEIPSPSELAKLFSHWPERFSEVIATICDNPMIAYEDSVEYLDRLMPLLRIDWEILFVQQRDNNNPAVTTFYKTLFDVLRRTAARFCCSPQHRHFTNFSTTARTVTLYYHSNSKDPQIWNYKEAYLPDYIHFDKMGYAGWSELALRPELAARSQHVDISIARPFYDSLKERYIKSNISKYRQMDINSDVGDSFIFVPMQLVHDTTQELGRIKTLELVTACINRIKDKRIVVKRHPLCVSPEVSHFLSDLEKLHHHVTISKNSVHDLISRCDAVVTVNSGVGFEALLHMKPVFVSGRCDYQYACRIINTEDDLTSVVRSINDPVNESQIVKFIYYMLNYMQCRVDDDKHVAMHLLRTLFVNSTRKL